MKRKFSKILGVGLVLALLTCLLLTAVPVLAWDEEDPEVASSEDFIWAQGWDGGYPNGTLESKYGEQSWSYFPTPSDGFNLYRDDVSGTGNLDAVQSLVTRTPDVIDLPGATVQYFDMDGGFYYMTIEDEDTWYWAMEPRGVNYTKADILSEGNVPGKGLDTASGLDKQFNPNSQAGANAGKK